MKKVEMMEAVECFIERHYDEMIDCWRTFVNLESHSKEPEAVNTAASWIKAEFEKTGMVCRLVDVGQNGNALVGILGEDRPGKPIIFGGHFDTVFPKGAFGENPFRMEDGMAYGPGVLDMKGGIVVALFVIKALGELGFDEAPLKIILSGDEEIGHMGSRCGDVYLEEGRGGKFAFNMETGLVDNALCVGRKGSLRAFLTVNGIESHSGNDFFAGKSAIEEMCHKVLRMQALTDPDKGTTVNTGTIDGGTIPNAVPAQCRAVVDVRVESTREAERMKREIERIVAECVVEKTSAEVTFTYGMPVYETTEDVMRFYRHVAAVAERYELPVPGYRRLGGGSDASFITMAGTPVICSFGVRGEWNHTRQEYAVVSSMPERVRLIAAVILHHAEFA